MSDRPILRTPLTVGVLLHFSSTREPHPNAKNEVYGAAIEFLEGVGAIVQEDTGGVLVRQADKAFRTTPLGAAWIQAILTTPLPRVAFIDEQGKVIE